MMWTEAIQRRHIKKKSKKLKKSQKIWKIALNETKSMGWPKLYGIRATGALGFATHHQPNS